jgi:hypothetical protein
MAQFMATNGTTNNSPASIGGPFFAEREAKRRDGD